MKNLLILIIVFFGPLFLNLYFSDCLALFFLLESVHIAFIMNPGTLLKKIYIKSLLYIESFEISLTK